MMQYRIAPPTVALLGEPQHDSEAVSELLHGEVVTVLSSSTDDWCRVRNRRDHYAGWLPADSLQAIEGPSTHWIAQRATLLFSEPDIKSRIIQRIGFCAEVTAAATSPHADDDPFLALDDGTYLFRAHALPIGDTLAFTPVEIALTRTLDAPYRWGGRSSDGYDCSGLVQACHYATGLALPRDSGEQERALAALATDGLGLAALPTLPDWQGFPARSDATVSALDDTDQALPGDLLYWRGHVAMMADEEHIVHATGHSLNTRVEPLAALVEREGDPRRRFRLIQR